MKTGEESDGALVNSTFPEGPLGPKTIATKTNLYRIIEAIQEEVPSGDDALVVALVSHLLSTGRIRVPISSELWGGLFKCWNAWNMMLEVVDLADFDEAIDRVLSEKESVQGEELRKMLSAHSHPESRFRRSVSSPE
jgi:hypothetical protein